MPKHAYKPLDDAAFAKLEEAGSSKASKNATSKNTKGVKTKFSADDKTRLNFAIWRSCQLHELSEAWSKKTEDVTREVAEHGLTVARARKFLEEPVRLYFLVYEEGTAELEFLAWRVREYPEYAKFLFPPPGTPPTDPDRKAEEARRLLSDFVAGAQLPDATEQMLIGDSVGSTGANRRKKELHPDRKKRKRARATDTHFWQLCADAEDVLKNSADKEVGCRLIEKFLKELFDHLPKTLTDKPPSFARAKRPKPPDPKGAFVQQAKRVRVTLEAEHLNGRPPGGARNWIRKVGVAGEDQPDQYAPKPSSR